MKWHVACNLLKHRIVTIRCGAATSEACECASRKRKDYLVPIMIIISYIILLLLLLLCIAHYNTFRFITLHSLCEQKIKYKYETLEPLLSSWHYINIIASYTQRMCIMTGNFRKFNFCPSYYYKVITCTWWFERRAENYWAQTVF